MQNSVPTKKIRVLVADDHPIIRQGLSLVLSGQNDMELIGEAEDGQQVIALAAQLKPDVILMDIQMPVKDGISAITEITQTNREVRILVLTSFVDDDKVFRAIKAGAIGYYLKDSRPQELVEAIRLIYRGEVALQGAIARRLIQEIKRPPVIVPEVEPLTSREMEILRCLARGSSNLEIAHQLSISDRTVGTHVRNILNKLHLANRTQAALYAIEQGITPPAKEQ